MGSTNESDLNPNNPRSNNDEDPNLTTPFSPKSKSEPKLAPDHDAARWNQALKKAREILRDQDKIPRNAPIMQFKIDYLDQSYQFLLFREDTIESKWAISEPLLSQNNDTIQFKESIPKTILYKTLTFENTKREWVLSPDKQEASCIETFKPANVLHIYPYSPHRLFNENTLHLYDPGWYRVSEKLFASHSKSSDEKEETSHEALYHLDNTRGIFEIITQDRAELNAFDERLKLADHVKEQVNWERTFASLYAETDSGSDWQFVSRKIMPKPKFQPSFIFAALWAFFERLLSCFKTPRSPRP